MHHANCITLSPKANAQAKASIVGAEGVARMGYRFESQGPGTHTFAPIADVRTKDYIVQPILGGVVVLIDPVSLEKGFGVDIDFDGTDFVFAQSERKLPVVEEETEEQKSETKARKAAAKAANKMAPGVNKTQVRRTVKKAVEEQETNKASKSKAAATLVVKPKKSKTALA